MLLSFHIADIIQVPFGYLMELLYLPGKAQIALRQLFKGCFHRAASRHHYNIPPGSKLLLIQPVDLPQPSAGAVADHCVAQLLADGNAHPVSVRPVFPGVEGQLAIGNASAVVKPLEDVVEFQTAGKLHEFFS